MARLPAISSADLSPEQQEVLTSLQRAGRATVTGPYSVLVRVPEIGALIRDLSFRMRTRTRLADRLFEVMVLTVARSWSAQYDSSCQPTPHVVCGERAPRLQVAHS
jgi:4-carboxymuconolactone decarboxylase